MKIYHYSLQELGVKTIDLGKRGENKVREIEFDLRDWIAEYPGASVALYISQPNTTVYLATTKMADGVLRWPIIDTYTAIPGFGDAEIVLSGAGGERLKSVTASIFVSDSLSDGTPGEAPDYMKPYVDQVAENAAKVEKALEEIKNIGTQSGNMPTGGSAGQFLAKKSAADYDTHWVNPPSGSGTGGTGSGLPTGGAAGQALVKQSDADGDAAWKALTAADVGAIGKNETAVNATKLNGKSADQYMLKTDTAADSEKLGGKDPKYYIRPKNILDNSDFEIARAGYNGYQGDTLLVADRWIASNISISVKGELKTLTASGAYCFIQQNVQTNGLDNGKTYTAAIDVGEGTIYSVTAQVPSAGVTADASLSSVSVGGKATLAIYKAASGMLFVRLIMSGAGTTMTFKRIFLYEGSYTADNLPPHLPKGYPVELMACEMWDVSTNKYIGYLERIEAAYTQGVNEA